MEVRDFAGFDIEQSLDAVEETHERMLVANAELFVLATHFADLTNGDTLANRTVLPGMERAVRLGGPGTPKVAEFACLAFGARMQLGIEATRHYVADALDVRHRLPQLWRGVTTGEVSVVWARMVAAKTRDLSKAAAARVDAATAPYADGRVSRGRFETIVDAQVITADPETAARQEQEAALKRFARATRGSEDGMRGFYIRGPLGVVARLDATVAYVAEALAALGDTDNLDDRRVKACLLLANPHHAVQLLEAYAEHRRTHPPAPDVVPLHEEDEFELPVDDGVSTGSTIGGDLLEAEPFRPGDPPWRICRQPGDPPPGFKYDPSHLLPPVTLYVHAHRETIEAGQGGVCRVEGHGPLSLQWVHEQLRPMHAYRIVPVLDLAGQAPVDAYEVPDKHREAVNLITPADAFPFGTRVGRPADSTHHPMDIDHTVPYAHGGVSGIGNYTPLTRFHHRAKTHGNWQVRQPFPGICVWRDPHGRHYLVDHTGTRRLSRGVSTSSTTSPEWSEHVQPGPQGQHPEHDGRRRQHERHRMELA